jgi:N-carbamoyl-L-amino-acid hydrolase
MWDEIVAAIHLAGAKRGVVVQIGTCEDSAPVQFPAWMRQIVTQACGQFTHQVVELPSGAGHDGSMIGLIAPAAMIFVRTKDGRSHCPEEFAAHDDIVAGVNALLQAVVAIDARSEE